MPVLAWQQSSPATVHTPVRRRQTTILRVVRVPPLQCFPMTLEEADTASAQRETKHLGPWLLETVRDHNWGSAA